MAKKSIPCIRSTLRRSQILNPISNCSKGLRVRKAIGEASPAYLVEPRAPERIYHYIPNAKIIAILRNPAERAYSHFLHLVKHNYETCHDFGLTLQKIEELKIGSWVPRRDYLLFGFYFRNVKRYYDIFEKKQIKILLFDDLKRDPIALDTRNFKVFRSR